MLGLSLQNLPPNLNIYRQSLWFINWTQCHLIRGRWGMTKTHKECRDLPYLVAWYLSPILWGSSSRSGVTIAKVVSYRAQSSRQQRGRAGGEKKEKKNKTELILIFLSVLSPPHPHTPTGTCSRAGRFFWKTKPEKLGRHFAKSTTHP